MKGQRSSKGFTLFELMVTIAIVALLVGLVIGGVQDFLETDMKKASARMASTMRYLYNKSVTEGLYLRLVLNIDEQTYWVEATRDPVLMTNPKREEIGGKTEEEEKEGEEKEGPVEQEEATAGPKLPKLELKKPQFSQVESYLLKPTRLPDGIFFKDVMTEHQPLPVEEGQATINYFPNGYVEHAIINLRDEDDELNYSLETNPITGFVTVRNEYKTLASE